MPRYDDVAVGQYLKIRQNDERDSDIQTEDNSGKRQGSSEKSRCPERGHKPESHPCVAVNTRIQRDSIVGADKLYDRTQSAREHEKGAEVNKSIAPV